MYDVSPHTEISQPRHPGQRRVAPLALVLLVLAALALLPAATSAQGHANDIDVRVTQVDSSSYPEVTLYVAVTRSAGDPLISLTRNDFAITEDGQPVTVTGFQGVGAPISAVLIIDRSSSMEDEEKLEGAQEAAQTFIDQMRPGDQTALVAFNHDVNVVQDFSTDKARLNDQVEWLYPEGGTAIYDSIVEGVDSLSSAQGRKVVILLTDGSDCRESNMCDPEFGSDTSLYAAIKYANESEQPIYVVGLGDRSISVDDTENLGGIDEAVLQRIADETYGVYYYAPDADQLAALYQELAGELQNEYVLTYTSPRPFYDGTRRDIRVHVGTTTSTGSYTERHLINVDSNSVVGVLLLLPLLALLLLPGVVGRAGWNIKLPGRRTRTQPAAQARGMPSSETQVTPEVAAAQTSSDVPCCAVCGAVLYHDASFCTECGAEHPASVAQPAGVAQQPVCIECGYQLRPGARFCGKCGTRQPAEEE